jgi:hypothetical protein
MQCMHIIYTRRLVLSLTFFLAHVPKFSCVKAVPYEVYLHAWSLYGLFLQDGQHKRQWHRRSRTLPHSRRCLCHKLSLTRDREKVTKQKIAWMNVLQLQKLQYACDSHTTVTVRLRSAATVFAYPESISSVDHKTFNCWNWLHITHAFIGFPDGNTAWQCMS